MNIIKNVINIAYSKYTMIQHPCEILDFLTFYRELNCKNILEIGSYLGGTFYTLCKLSHIEGFKITIDDPVYKNQKDELERDNTYKKMMSFADNVSIIKSNSHSPYAEDMVSGILKNQKLDFIFIDGDHTYEGVKKDYEMYKQFLKKDGYIAFHDIIESEYHRSLNCHVSKFWNELPNENKIEFNSHSFCMGIGVIQV